jgi:hypothetical protein
MRLGLFTSAVPEPPKGDDRRAKLPAPFGELVFNSGRNLGIDRARDEASGLKFTKPDSDHLRACVS